MKKFAAMLLACMMVLCCAASLAETNYVSPDYTDPQIAFDSGDCVVMARFDPATAFEIAGKMDFIVIEDDLYSAEAVKALQPGDSIELFGQEVVIKTISETENGYIVNADDPEATAYELTYYTEDKLMCSEEDWPYRTELEEYVLPLADEVTVAVWQDENGNMSEELNETVMASAELKDFFMARTDMEQDNYLNTTGNHVTIRVQDGKVTEIRVDWGSDD